MSEQSPSPLLGCGESWVLHVLLLEGFNCSTGLKPCIFHCQKGVF